MKKYRQKKILTISLIVIFIFLAIMSVDLYIFYNEIYILAIAAVCITFTLIIAVVEPTEIIIDSNGIKINKHGKPYQNCRWDWIYDVKTFRSGTGTFQTLLSYSEDPEKRFDGRGFIFRKDSEGGIISVSAHFENYVNMLREIREKAINAQFDETTEKIIKDDIRMSTARKIFWLIAVLFFVFVFFIYIILLKRGI